MKPYDNLDTLYDFLRRIRTVDEFFEKKEPEFNDAFMREMAHLMIADGDPEEYVLSALKKAERQHYAQTLKARTTPH